MASAEYQELESVRAGLECPRHVRGEANAIKDAEVADLAVYLDSAGSAEHNHHLLGVLVAVAEWLAHVRAQTLVADARTARIERAVGEP